MGHLIFGKLAKIRGVVYFRLSPYEQKTFGGMISHGLPNMVRRIKENVLTVTPPFVLTYLLINWAEAENERQSRKNPKEFENDV